MPEMLLLPAALFAGLIYAALGLTAFGVLCLLWLLLRDARRKSIW